MKKFTALFLCAALLICTLNVPVFPIQTTTVYADESAWPKKPSIVGTSACLIEASTGTILYQKKPHKKMYPASITKILTALVTLEHADLNEDVTFSETAVNSIQYGDANMEMQVGEVMSVQDCLYGLMLKSANEVAVGLAEHVAGSVKDFAQLMNERAKEAGATDSHFVNPNGLHDDDHYITAYDMAMITRAAIQNPVFLSISGSTEYTVSSNKKKNFVVYQRHKMVKEGSLHYDGILGGKTGFTDQSGTTLVTYAKRNGMTLICVVLKSNGINVYNDTTALLNYGFDNFNLVKPSDNDNRFQKGAQSYTDTLTPLFGTKDNASLSINSDDNIVLPKNASFSDVTSEIRFDVSDSDRETDSQSFRVADIHYTYDGHAVGTASILYRSDTTSLETSKPSDSEATTSTAQTKEKELTTPKTDEKKSKKAFLSRSDITKIIIAVSILLLFLLILFLIRKQQKRLNEIRANKRRRSY